MFNMLNQMNYQNNFFMPQETRENIIMKEFIKCKQDDDLPQIGCTFKLDNNSINVWKVTMNGPKDTPYANGIFLLKIYFPHDYPHHGPDFRFVNKIYHLNVDFRNMDTLGHISCNHLNEWHTTGKVHDWPEYGIKQALFDIFCLFYNQGIDDSYDETMAEEYYKERDIFNEKARKWTLQYASHL